MMTLVTGGSKCGKSHCAERILDGFPGRKFYIAAMRPHGAEAHAAIARHRALRQGKGFETIEQYTDLSELTLPEGCAALLECAGNLCANEMFRDDALRDPAEQIVRDFAHLRAQTAELVIVTNEVGSDGIAYAEGTAAYIAAMGRINRLTAAMADNVIECVYGIPLVRKGRLPC